MRGVLGDAWRVGQERRECRRVCMRGVYERRRMYERRVYERRSA
jgi:hypothetical protein